MSYPRAHLVAVLASASLLLAAAEKPNLQNPPQEQEEPHNHNLSRDVAYRTTVDLLAADPATAGEWALPMDWPANAVHAVLLHTGKVLWWRGDETVPTSYTWDPVSNQLQSQTATAIIWCGGNSILDDGRVLVTGGATMQGASTGPRWAFIFDPLTLQWTRTPDMRKGRYYPTNTVLGDGRTLVFAGTDENGATNEQVEAFVVGGGAGGADLWDLLTAANKKMTYYPRMHLLSTGEILHTGPEKITDLFDPIAQTWQVLATSNYGKRTHGTSVMLPAGHNRLMIVGGRDRSLSDPLATNTAEIIDVSQPTPTWTYANPMTWRRMHANTVILPDGKVLVAGGTTDEDLTPAYPAELFDPATGSWTVVASMRTRRGYHSSAVLLPDGRVLWAGSNGNDTAEVYSPPYLFHGPRPVIDSVTGSIQYGETIAVQTPDAASITSVVMIRLGASTHATNMEQRYVPVTFVQNGPAALSVTSPAEPNIAPPGYYMLFILNGNGVPSVSRFVRLGGTFTGNRRPIVDAGLNQTIILPLTSSLDGTVTDDGLPPPGVVQTTWTMESGPGTVTFDNDQEIDTNASFSDAGTYLLRLTANDGELIGTDTISVVVNAAGSGGYPVEVRVSTGSDDAEESATGSMSLTSSDLEMVLDGNLQKVGVRFNNVAVPQGELIVRAWVQFKVDEVNSEDTSLLIQGHDTDSAPIFTSTAGNISSRARTSEAAAWSPAPWTTVGEVGFNQRTSDISRVIQEIVDRPGWSKGSSLALIFTGTGKRVAKAYEGLSTGAALLHLELANPPVNSVPLVNAGADQTIRLPGVATLDATVTDDGLPNPPGAVSTLWVKESGPITGVVTFANPNAIDTTASFSEPGRYALELEANDGQLLGSGAVAIQVDPAIPGLTNLDRQVAAGADDAEEKASGSISVTGGDLELVTDGSSVQKTGVRFTGVSIPPGATIHTAWLQFQADETHSGPTALTIQGQAANNPGPFTITKFDVSMRARTSASVSWAPFPWNTVGEAGAPQRTPDLTAIVQEIVRLPGWLSGNSIVFILTGSGTRTAESFEGGAAKAPRLHVEYN